MKCLNCGFIDNLIKGADDIYGDPQCAKCKSGAYEIVEPLKSSEEGVQGPNAVPSGYGHIDPRDAEAIRADERAKIAKQIEEFAHKEMKDGNWAYEKLLILLKSLK